MLWKIKCLKSSIYYSINLTKFNSLILRVRSNKKNETDLCMGCTSWFRFQPRLKIRSQGKGRRSC